MKIVGEEVKLKTQKKIKHVEEESDRERMEM